MTSGTFSRAFSSEFDIGTEFGGSGLVPLYCPKLVLEPDDFKAPGGSLPILFADFNALRDNPTYTTFDALKAAFTDFNHILQGHPGFPGGAPNMPTGSGMYWGYAYAGAEWWVTEATGVDDSAQWVADTVDPAGRDGTWLNGVRATGRDVTIKGMVLCDSHETVVAAKAIISAALAVPPRHGWLTYELDRRLPVALSGQTKVRAAGQYALEVQMTLKGVDVGTPGGGVHWEGVDGASTWVLPWSVSTGIELDGNMPSPPTIIVKGAAPAGTTIAVGAATVTLAEAVTTGHTLTIDCRRRLVTLDGAPRRSAITLTAWPLLTVGATTVLADDHATGTPSGSVRLSAVSLY